MKRRGASRQRKQVTYAPPQRRAYTGSRKGVGGRKPGGESVVAKRRRVALQNLVRVDATLNETQVKRKQTAVARCVCFPEEERVGKVVNGLLHTFRTRAHIVAGLEQAGSKNCISRAGARHLMEALHGVKPLSKQSVVIDFGSGAGVLLIYFALMFGCHVVGFEVHEGLVRMAGLLAKNAGVSELCTFHCADFAADEEKAQAVETLQQATHVIAFDGVFREGDRRVLFEMIVEHAHDNVVGASTSSRFNRWHPAELSRVSTSLESKSIKLCGGESSFSFCAWQKDAI